MYGQTIDFDLTLHSTVYAPITIPAHVTETPAGIEFRFSFEENEHVSGRLLVRTDAGTVVEVRLGSDHPGDGDLLEVGDWGFRERIATDGTDPLPAEVDEQTRDTLRSLIYSAIAYAQAHTARITARLDPARPELPTTTDMEHP